MNIKPKYGDKLFCSTKRGDERVGVWKLTMPYNIKFDAVSLPAASLIPLFVFASLGLSGKVFADIRRDQWHRLEFTAFAGITWAG